MKEQARGPKKWQTERPRGESWNGPPRRSFGGGERGPAGGWGGPPPRRSFGQDGERGAWQERPRRSFSPGGERGGFAPGRDQLARPPRRTYQRDGEAAPRHEEAVAERSAPLVAPKALVRGLKEAKQALAEVVEALANDGQAAMDVETVEAPVSFAADGRFLGFGRGGATTLTITLSALDAEDALAPAEEHVAAAPAEPPAGLLHDEVDEASDLDIDEVDEDDADREEDAEALADRAARAADIGDSAQGVEHEVAEAPAAKPTRRKSPTPRKPAGKSRKKVGDGATGPAAADS